MGEDGGYGDHLDPAPEPIYKPGGEPQLCQDHSQIEAQDSAGVASCPLHGYVDIVEEQDHQAEQFQDKVGSPFPDKFLRGVHEPEKGDCVWHEEE